MDSSDSYDINLLYIDYLNNKYDINELNNMNMDLSEFKTDNGYKGVQIFKKNKYRVQIVHDNHTYSLGVFDNKIIAAKKYAAVYYLLNNKYIGGKIKFNTCKKKNKIDMNSDCLYRINQD